MLLQASDKEMLSLIQAKEEKRNAVVTSGKQLHTVDDVHSDEEEATDGIGNGGGDNHNQDSMEIDQGESNVDNYSSDGGGGGGGGNHGSDQSDSDSDDDDFLNDLESGIQSNDD